MSAIKIVKELEKIDIYCSSEEETIDIILKIGKENNIPTNDISWYITEDLVSNIISFNGDKNEIQKIIKKTIEEE